MKVLVTGAAGRLGTATCNALVESGFEVVGLDRRYSAETNCPLHVVDLLIDTTLYPFLRDVGAVVHLANHPNNGSAPANRLYIENMTMNFNVIHAAAEVGVGRIVFASSIQAIHGTRSADEEDQPSQLPYLPLDGDLPPNPDNPYAVSKVAGEQLLEHYVRHQGLRSGVALRLPMLIRREWIEAGYFTREHRSERRWRRHSRIDEGFSMLMYEDAGHLISHILRADLPGYRCYLPAGPGLASPLSVAEAIQRYYPNVPQRKPLDGADSLVDVSRITAETGWVPAALPAVTAASGE